MSKIKDKIQEYRFVTRECIECSLPIAYDFSGMEASYQDIGTNSPYILFKTDSTEFRVYAEQNMLKNETVNEHNWPENYFIVVVDHNRVYCTRSIFSCTECEEKLYEV